MHRCRPLRLLRRLRSLNYSGVPWVGLIIACVLPLAILLFEADASDPAASSGGIAMHLPDDFPGLGLELWAVRS